MKNKPKIPSTFTIVFCVIIFVAICTWVIPGGEFVRQTVEIDGETKEFVVPDSYHRVSSQPQTWQIFSAFFKGFVKTSNIIIFIFLIGGAFWIFNYTNAIMVGVNAFLKRMQGLQQRKVFARIDINMLIITLIMIMFSLFGAIFGMSEETIAFTMIFVPIALSMGYDSIVGISMCYLAAHVGFAGAMLNPFTIGIAQGLAQLPTFSGLGYRFVCWLVFTFAGICFVVWYAKKVKKNPEFSPMYQWDNLWREKTQQTTVANNEPETVQRASLSAWIVWLFLTVVFVVVSFFEPITTIVLGKNAYALPIIPVLTALFFVISFVCLRKNIHYFILNLLLFSIFALIVGVLGYQWYVMEIATLFFIMGICAGIAYSCSLDKIFQLFLEGCKDIMSAALIVGLAGGIIVILQDGKIIDTILYAMSNAMQDAGKFGSLSVMFVFQNLLNLIIPSGSAKAALTIPMMAEFADMLHISRQTMVLAFQFGDGITNMITPASGVLLGCLGAAKIPYSVWVKWIWKFILFLIVVGFLLLLPTLYFSFNGF